jgi:hypothetical protein
MSDCEHDYQVMEGRGHEYICCSKCNAVMNLSTALWEIKRLTKEVADLNERVTELQEELTHYGSGDYQP